MNAIILAQDLDEVSARRLSLLEAATDKSAAQPGARFDLRDIAGYAQADADAQELASDDLLSCLGTAQGMVGVRTTPTGDQFMAQVHKLRSDILERRKFTRHTLARWMLVQPSQTELLRLHHYLADQPSFYGDPLSEDDLKEAASWLDESGYLAPKPVVAWGDDYLLARLSPAGQQWAESNGDPAVAVPSPSPVFTIGHVDIRHSNLAIGSSNAVQTVGVTVEALQAFIQGVSLRLADAGLSEDDREEVHDALERIASETESPTPKSSRLKAALRQISRFADSVGSSALGGYLAIQIPALLAMLAQQG